MQPGAGLTEQGLLVDQHSVVVLALLVSGTHLSVEPATLRCHQLCSRMPRHTLRTCPSTQLSSTDHTLLQQAQQSMWHAAPMSNR